MPCMLALWHQTHFMVNCNPEKTNYHLSCQPRTCKVMGSHLNLISFAKCTGHLILPPKDFMSQNSVRLCVRYKIATVCSKSFVTFIVFFLPFCLKIWSFSCICEYSILWVLQIYCCLNLLHVSVSTWRKKHMILLKLTHWRTWLRSTLSLSISQYISGTARYSSEHI